MYIINVLYTFVNFGNIILSVAYQNMFAQTVLKIGSANNYSARIDSRFISICTCAQVKR